ncbi:MAG TPA: hypothetical protein VGE13_04155 [Candidatus Saccharimonadales bacterium]
MKNVYDSLRSPRNRNKLIPPAIVASVVGGVALAAIASPDSPEKAPYVEVSASAHGEDVIGRSESGWIEGAATRAVEEALEKGIAKVLAESGIDGGASSVQAIMKDLPTYTKVGDAIEKAGDDKDFIPDSGDKFAVDLEVTAAGKDISYEVTDAYIVDLPNNQQ